MDNLISYMFGQEAKSLVLVVNSDPELQEIISTVLQKEYQIIEAKTCSEAWEIANDALPDLILLDIEMPDFCGLELCRIFKKHKNTRQIPVIFLVSDTREEYFMQALDAGGVDFIRRPVNRLELLVRIKKQMALWLKYKQLQKAMDLIPHRILAKDTTGNIVLANKSAAAFFNSEVDQILYRPEPSLPEDYLYEIIVGKDQFAFKTEAESIVTFEERLQTPDGSQRFFQKNFLPFTFSERSQPSTLEVAIDITVLKEKQEAINCLNDWLQQHNTYKDKLLSVIAHDLVNLIFCNALLMKSILRDSDEKSKKEILNIVEIITFNNKNIQDLLQNLLMWSRQQFEAISFNPTDLFLEKELNIVIELMQLQTLNKGVEIRVNVPRNCFVKADVNMLQTIFRNLISNAIKFSESGKEILITARKRTNRIYLAVTDHGVGMKPDKIQQILGKMPDRGNIVSSGTSGERGAGLGLQLCKDFIKQHGCELKIKSQVGKGSKFYFSVPSGVFNAV